MPSNKLKSEDRCAHLRADGKRCASPRAKAHDCFCIHHWRVEERNSDRASRTPEAAAYVAEALGSITQFKTATSVNDALGKLFALRARKLVSERDAIVFAYIIQLMLQTLQETHQEFTTTHDSDAWNEVIEQAIRSVVRLRPAAPSEPARAASNDAKPKRRQYIARAEDSPDQEQPAVEITEQGEGEQSITAH